LRVVHNKACDQCVKLTTRVYLVSRLNTRGTIPPIYVFIVCTGTHNI